MFSRFLLTAMSSVSIFLCAAAEIPAQFQTEVCKVLPEAKQFEPSSPKTFVVRDAAGKTLGKLYMETIDDGQRKFGYAGTIEIAILFDTQEEVIGVLIGKNSETPAYLNRISRMKFLEQWNKLKMAEIPTKNVDSVTRATYSSEAIKYGVRKLAESYLEKNVSAEENARTLQAEITELERRVASLKAGLARSEATRKQLQDRKEDELELRLIAAIKGPDEAAQFAKDKNLIYFNRPRGGGPANREGNAPRRGGEGSRPEGDAANHAGGRRPSPVDAAVTAYKADPSAENLAVLKTAILADYEQRLQAPLSPRDQENARALKATAARLEELKAKK